MGVSQNRTGMQSETHPLFFYVKAENRIVTGALPRHLLRYTDRSCRRAARPERQAAKVYQHDTCQSLTPPMPFLNPD